jgi:Rieske Fe-S protein
MKRLIERRKFLATIWKWAFGLVAAAGIWTSWDVLQPASPSGFGGKIRGGSPADIPPKGIVTVEKAQTHLTKNGDEVVALWWRCTHLGCRVPWCESAGEFECPCHGSRFNRIGEYRAGPAPRGLDRFAVAVDGDTVVIDTGSITQGPPPGPESIDEPPGPMCIGGGE